MSAEVAQKEMPAIQVKAQQKNEIALVNHRCHWYILADEPTGNLDEDNAKTVLGYLSQYVTDGGCVLLVTHDDRAASHATRTLKMSQGQLIA